MSNQVVHEPSAEMTAATLIETGSYHVDQTGDRAQWRKWKSGILAPVYCNTRSLSSGQQSQRSMTLVVAALAAMTTRFFSDADLIVGLADGGIVWSSPVAIDMGINHALIRKQAKSHGVGGRIAGVDGADYSGAKAVIVDDLVASGKTVIEGARVLKDELGVETMGVVSIVNWCFPTTLHRFAESGIVPKTLTSWPQIIDQAYRHGLLTEAGANELNVFYQDPAAHVWNPEVFKMSEEVNA